LCEGCWWAWISAMGNETIRVFLAIGLPEDIRERIRRVQQELKRSLGDVKWVRPEGIHLTLKFFGSVGMDEVERIAPVVAGMAGRTAPMVLSLEKAGGFPDLRRTRVLWIGVGGEIEKLAALQRDIEDGLEGAGFAREERPFTPHLTLGRARDSRSGIAGAREAITGLEGRIEGSLTAGGLVLYKSDLRPEGAVYSKLKYFSFDA
jgi:RNA 2',3'-cyclic 3'-phosphodiesterase